MLRANKSVMLTVEEYDRLQEKVAKNVLFGLRDRASSPVVLMLMAVVAASISIGIRYQLFGKEIDTMDKE